ncbi:ABC transporter substrate-binding protein [Variovorax sp. Sphag1AA]|uniref:ABC transporter substrate-binding protein n=1 Tax=Variovorax sp. Sphag1AA TaxID=2587027 RepID=UPI00161E34AA|nr:ABC transporter substrate-binding protein [Variovorax sp. Sphag1AA]MBB3179885.1 putative ABC transport system substrate-binding protein [Variovorax sp. Sphag1AA]
MRSKSPRFLFCTALLAAASLAPAQQPPKKAVRIGYLAAVSATADAPRLEAFRQGMRDLGYVEGQNLQIDYRHESEDLGRLPNHAADLVAMKIDVLVAVTTNAAQAAKKSTSTVPIVFMGVTDPITTGLAESLARPGGNATGVTNVAAILTGKRLEILKETNPKMVRVAVLWDPKAPGSIPQWEASQQPARQLGLELYSMEASSAESYAAAFKEAVKARAHAVWVTLNPVANSNQKLIAELAIENNLPSICARGDYAENGCLMAYGPGYGNEGKDGARYVVRILKGAKPADLPIEQPTKFELLINLKTANRLGYAIPRSVLSRADKVIQ